MTTFAHAHTDDPLGLATAATIILTDVRGGERNQFVEVFDATAAYLAAAAQAIKPIEEWQIDYEILATGSLVVALGSLVNIDYLVTGLSANSRSDGYPTASLTAIKLSSAAKFVATGTGSITVTGGFGLVNKLEATFSKGISSSLSLSMQTAEALEETSGDYLDEGYTLYGMKKECQVEAYDAITIPVAGKQTASDLANSGRTAWGTQTASWFEYI
jgi:hypothetical protein